MTLATMMAADLTWAIAELPQTFTYKGTTYSGAINETANRGVDDMEGNIVLADCVLTVAKSVLATAPARGEQITVRGRAMRVDGVIEDGAGVAWIIELKGLARK